MLRKACRKSRQPSISFVRLKPSDLITRLNRCDPNSFQTCESILRGLATADIAVVSHEFLESNGTAILNICLAAQQVGYRSILIIGYTRRQDHWRRSNFNQWTFRNTKQLRRSAEVVQKEGWKWQLFSGYERWLITGLIEQEGPDWNAQVHQYRRILHSVQIPCRIISSPMSISRKPEHLLNHFNDCCQLGLSETFLKKCTSIKNASFSEYITETIAESILLTKSNHFPITPHQQNDLLKGISTHLPRRIKEINGEFLSELEGHYLSIFRASNQAYCDQMKISFEDHFPPKPMPPPRDSNEFKSLISEENRRRRNRPHQILEWKASVQASATRAILQTLCDQNQKEC